MFCNSALQLCFAIVFCNRTLSVLLCNRDLRSLLCKRDLQVRVFCNRVYFGTVRGGKDDSEVGPANAGGKGRSGPYDAI